MGSAWRWLVSAIAASRRRTRFRPANISEITECVGTGPLIALAHPCAPRYTDIHVQKGGLLQELQIVFYVCEVFFLAIEVRDRQRIGSQPSAREFELERLAGDVETDFGQFASTAAAIQ